MEPIRLSNEQLVTRKKRRKNRKNLTGTDTQNVSKLSTYTAQKMKFSIEDFFSKYDQIRSFLRIWSHLLKKYLMENFIFCAVIHTFHTSQLQLTRLRFASFFLLSVYLIYHLKMLLRSYSATVIKYYYVYVTCTPTENFFKFR